MSNEEDDQDLLTIIWLGNESEKNKIKLKFSRKLVNIDELKEYLIDKRDSSIIVILSDDIPIDNLSPMNFPSICAVYNDKLVCLYCLPTMNSLVDKYLKQNAEEESPKKSYPLYTLLFLQKYWFFVGLILIIPLAYFFPNVGKTGGYIRSEWSIKWGCVMLIFFLSGLSVRTKELFKEFLHIRLHIFVQIYSLLIIPFIVYGLGLLLIKFSMNKILVFGIIMIGSTCTTISSNAIMTKNAMGNEHAALLNAILGNILGIFISPAIILYFIKNPNLNFLSNTKTIEKRIDYISVIKELSLAVLIPLFIGQIIHALWTKQVTYIRNKFHLSQLNNLALLAMIWSVFCTCFANKLFETIETKDLAILILINMGIYFGFLFIIIIIARLPIPYWQFSKQDTVAITFCGVMKSLAVGVSLINAFFHNENQEFTGLLVLPFVVYHVQQLILSAFVVIFLKKWIKNELKKQSLTKIDHQNIQLTHQDNLQIKQTENI
jgi:sodium/bile acid cotransporter 7